MCIYAAVGDAECVYVDCLACQSSVADSCVLIQDVAYQAGGPEATVLEASQRDIAEKNGRTYRVAPDVDP